MIYGFKDRLIAGMLILVNKREWKHYESFVIPEGGKKHFSCGPYYRFNADRKDVDTYLVGRNFKKASATGSKPQRNKFFPGRLGPGTEDTLYHYSSEEGQRINGLPRSFTMLNLQQAADKLTNNWYSEKPDIESDIIQREFDIDIYGVDKIDQLAIHLPYMMNQVIGLISRSLNWEANHDMIGSAIQTETLRILRGDFLYSHMLPFFTKLERILKEMSCSNTNIFSDAVRLAHIDVAKMIDSMNGLSHFSNHAFSNFFRDYPWISTLTKSIKLLKKWGDKSIVTLNHSVADPISADRTRRELRSVKQQLREMETSASKWRKSCLESQAANQKLMDDFALNTNELAMLRTAQCIDKESSCQNKTVDKSIDSQKSEELDEVQRTFSNQINVLNNRIDVLGENMEKVNSEKDAAVMGAMNSHEKFLLHMRFMRGLLAKMTQPPSENLSHNWEIEVSLDDLESVINSNDWNDSNLLFLQSIHNFRSSMIVPEVEIPEISIDETGSETVDATGDNESSSSDTRSDFNPLSGIPVLFTVPLGDFICFLYIFLLILNPSE